MPHEQSVSDASLSVALSVRHLVEFLLCTGSIDNRFVGFDRAQEGARLHRILQRNAAKQYPDYQAEVFLKESIAYKGIQYTIEGRADGIFTDSDGTVTIDEIKTTALPPDAITGEQSPEHWAQGQVYAAIFARQNNLKALRVQLTYYQIDEEVTLQFSHDYSADELWAILTDLLRDYTPWAQRSAQEQQQRTTDLQGLTFPFPNYRPGQKALIREVYTACQEGGQLLCQAPTGIGKTMSVLFPALKALGNGVGGPIFYLTARGTTRAAAEDALSLLRQHTPSLQLRSVTLTAKDKICLCESHECNPESCPYANGYFERRKTAIWDALDRFSLTAKSLRELADKHLVCPFELGLDVSLWSDVIIGDYNYLFDPVVRLRRFFDGHGDYVFLVDEAHNLPDRARDMHSASLTKSAVYDAKKRLGKGKSPLKNALTKVNTLLVEWRHRCEAQEQNANGERFGKVLFQKERDETFDRALQQLCEPLQNWLDEHREHNETHEALLQLYFSIHAWLRVAETFNEHFVLQTAAYGSEVRLTQLCLDPSAFLAEDFARGRAAVLFSATLAPASYYKDLCGLPEAHAVALRSPFPAAHLGLFCACDVSTRYKDRDTSINKIVEYLAALVHAKAGNYLAFFPSYAYLQQVYEHFRERYPSVPTTKQESGLDEAGRIAFLAQFVPNPSGTLLGFAVLGGIFGEGVDLIGNRLIGAAIIGPGLPQIGPRQEQMKEYFEQTRGSGFDYAYRYPGMNKVLQAAGRVIRTPLDKGVLLLLDDRFVSPGYRTLMPPHWSHLLRVNSVVTLQDHLGTFWSITNS